MPELDMEKLTAGRAALERWQTPAEFRAKVEELAEPIKSEPLFNRTKVRFLMDAMALAEFVKLRPTQQVHLVEEKEQWPDGQMGTPQSPLDIEITEVLEEGRKRGEEYRKDGLPQDGTAEDWYRRALAIPEQLEKAIERKVRKSYPEKCTLLVYLNMSTYGILRKETEAAIAAIKAKYANDFREICVLWQEKLF
jgi:hypothetical protein